MSVGAWCWITQRYQGCLLFPGRQQHLHDRAVGLELQQTQTHRETLASRPTAAVPPGQAPTLPDKLGHNSLLQKLSKKQEEDDALLAKHGLGTDQQALVHEASILLKWVNVVRKVWN